MLCENCGQREATCHICEIVEDVTKSRNLCSECLKASSSVASHLAAQHHNARCSYCGGQPCAGGTDPLALVTGTQKLKFMCMPCSMEHNRFIQEQLQQDISRLSQQEQLTFIRKLDEQANEHMRLWVSEGRSQ